MAGYFLYSLDTTKFLQLVEQPTEAQLKWLCKSLAERLTDVEDAWEEDDPLSQWPTKAKELGPKILERLALPDWYGDLSDVGQEVWEGLIFDLCTDKKKEVGFRVESDGIYWDLLEVAWAALGVPAETITKVALSRFGTSPYRRQPVPVEGSNKPVIDPAERRADFQKLNQLLEEVNQDPSRLLNLLSENADVPEYLKKATAAFLSDDDDEAADDGGWLDWHPMHSMHLPAEVKQMLAEVKSVEATILASDIDGVREQYENDLLPTLERLAKEERMLFVQVDT